MFDFLLKFATFCGILVVLFYILMNYITRRYTSIYDLNLVGRERDENDKGNSVVVMGGGLAGLLSARVLLNHFKNVIIVESEDYDHGDMSRVRPSVPQGAHAHLMLAIATKTFKALFPGIESELLARGGHCSDLGKAMKWFYWSSWRVRTHINAPFWSCTRPFLDRLIRDMFMHLYGDKVTILPYRRIVSPLLSTDIPQLKINSIYDDNTNTYISKTHEGIPVTGSYSLMQHINPYSDEFRIAGIRVKKRAVQGNNTTNTTTTTTSTDIDDATLQQQRASANLTDINIVPTTTASSTYKPINAYTTSEHLRTHIPSLSPSDDHNEQYILADLIVDCTGGTSLFSQWCTRWGIDIPSSTLKANSMYVSHLFHEPDNFNADWLCAPIYPTPGHSSYFGYLMRVENKLWQVTAMGTAGHSVPNTSLPQWIHHLRRLDNPLIHELVSKATPVGGESLHTYHPKMYVRRHWDRAIGSIPDGVICVGNSACVFDPMYGQGMSGACIGALALNTLLCNHDYSTASALSHFTFSRSYFTILNDRLLFPWTLCVVEDSRWENVELNNTAQDIKESTFGKCLKYWIRQGMVLAHTEPLAQATAMGIMNMTSSFTTLLYPPLVYKVLLNVWNEMRGTAYTPEMMYYDQVLPEKEKREQWQMTLGGDDGMQYECIKDHHD